MLLLPEGQMSVVWGPSKKQCFFENLDALDRKVHLLFFRLKKGLDVRLREVLQAS
jgi:hypothetical protein